MAFLTTALTEDEVRKTPVSQLRPKYNKLASDYNKIVDGQYIRCPVCGDWKSISNSFYSDKRFATGFFYECKECLRLEVEQKRTKRDEPNETPESVQRVLQKMDLPYIDKLYRNTVKNINDNVGERGRTSPFLSYIVQIKSLPQHSKKSWKDSDFGLGDDPTEVEIKDSKRNAKIIKDGKKRFGINYDNNSLYWLENEYEDWIARYPCESKAQEVLFRTLCQQELERENIRKNGGNTKDIDKSIQDTLNSLGIKPSQSNENALADQMSFGQLIDKWESEKPIPEPEDEFKDPDKIGLLIDVFFKGHLSKMMGLKNAFSNLYEKYIKKYTVEKPELNEEEEEALFNQIFGEEVEIE